MYKAISGTALVKAKVVSEQKRFQALKDIPWMCVVCQ